MARAIAKSRRECSCTARSKSSRVGSLLPAVFSSIFDTRQTEFAKELAPVPSGYPRYGSTLAGPPSDWTWLRIVKRAASGDETYTAYTSTDGQFWTRGGTWTHTLGSGATIGLVSIGGTGFVAQFDYVRVFTLLP